MVRIIAITMILLLLLLLVQFLLGVYYGRTARNTVAEKKHFSEYTENYQGIVEENHRLAQIRHDLVKLQRVTDETGEAETGERAGGATGDLTEMILQAYSRLAQENGIAFTAERKHQEPIAEEAAGRELPMRELSGTRLLTNLLDNAFEACARVQQGEKRVRIVLDKNYLLVENTKRVEEHPQETEFSTFKADKKLHGHGMGIISELVKESGGALAVKDMGEWFTVCVRF